MEHRVIVTADDFGACNFIDNGIREAIKSGVVSCISSFINFEPRNSRHPYGSYKGSVQAIKDLLHDVQHSPEFSKNRNLRVGLHFNFHAGSPVYQHENKIKSLLLRRRVNDRRIFKNIEKFNPSKVEKKEFAKELHAQYSRFFNQMGFAPDHFSSHFPIIFMTPEFFDIVCAVAAPMGIPVRNPFLVWQTKNEPKDSPNRDKLSNVKKFFKKKSKTKEIGLKRAIKMADTLTDTILAGWKTKNVNALRKNGIDFPDYTNCHLYGNGTDPESVKNVLNNLLDFSPSQFKKHGGKPVVTEVITHVGKGTYKTEQVPHGIDSDYFKGRGEELATVTASKELQRRKLYNYKSALQA